MTHPVTPHTDAPVPPGLIDAFWRYDAALLSNDTRELDSLFEQSDHTLRADGNGILEGHAAISDFRAARPDRPTRRITRWWTRVLADDLVYTTAEVRSATGAAGLQTQLWRRTAHRWQIAAAHVTPPSKPVESTIWRVAGSPLLAGAGDGPLSGETVAVKDLFAVAGVARSGGVKAYLAEQDPQADSAVAVRRLLDAGASVTGVTHTDQFAFGLAGQNADFGTPVNLAAPTRIPGGSTSGSAAAVRHGWSSIGLGTDTAGSIRVPSSYQGLWGFRPTHGAVSTDGALPLAPSFDTVSWLTRDAATLIAVGQVLLPDDDAPAPTDTVWSPDVIGPADPLVQDIVRDTARTLSAQELPPLPALAEWTAAFRTVQAHEAWEAHGKWITAHPSALGPEVKSRFHAGSTVTEADLADARDTLRTARTTLAGLLDGRALMLPTVGSATPQVNATPAEVDAHRQSTLRLTTLASLTGFPAVSIPALSLDGAPLGLSLVGAAGSDRGLMELAGRIGAELGA
ncbi:AtzH-like domain-containing protein [Rhodococcus sp. NPDC003322]